MSRILYSPPPPSIATATIDQLNPSSSSSSSSIMIVTLTIVSAIIISISLYLLLRFLSHRRSSSSSNDVVISSTTSSSNNTNRITLHKHDDNLLDHLPIFTFRSLTTTNSLTAADCAVCLSKFEPNDQLRLLPFCCHAFHAPCIDTWLKTNYTCPLCRSSLDHNNNNNNDNADLSDNNINNSNSFRVSIGSVSRRRNEPDAGNADHVPVRSFSVGSFEYVVEVDGFEVPVGSTQLGRLPECGEVGDKECGGGEVAPPGERVAAEVGGGGRSWLRDYVERITLVSSRSLRSSGRFFPGSGRRSEGVAVVGELESSRIGEEISEVFRWLSGV